MHVLTAIAMLTKRIVPPVDHAAQCDPALGLSDQPRTLEKPLVIALAHTTGGAATAVLLRGM